jgi:hypothetical protein
MHRDDGKELAAEHERPNDPEGTQLDPMSIVASFIFPPLMVRQIASVLVAAARRARGSAR